MAQTVAWALILKELLSHHAGWTYPWLLADPLFHLLGVEDKAVAGMDAGAVKRADHSRPSVARATIGLVALIANLLADDWF
jgi:hypothetical protein